MSITFQCSCGKNLAAKDEYAGKRMRCPACQAILTIPSAAAAPTEAVKPAGAKRASPPPLPPQSETPKRRPPPRESDDFREPRRAARKPDPWEDSTFGATPSPVRDEDERPARKAPRSQSGPGKALVLVVIVALLLGGGGGAVYYFWPQISQLFGSRTANLTDLDFVPDDAVGFVSVRPADLWNGPTMKAVRPALEAFGGLQGKAEEFRQHFGLGIDDMERVTVVLPEMPQMGPMGFPGAGFGGKAAMPPGAPPEGMPPGMPAGATDANVWILIYATKSLDQTKIKQALGAMGDGLKHEGKLYYPLTNPLLPGGNIHFVNDRLFVLAPPTGIKDFLERKEIKTGSGPLQPALTLARENKHFVLGVTMPPEIAPVLPMIAAFGKVPPEVQPFLQIQSGALAIHDAEDTEFDLRLVFPDDVKAQNARAAAQLALNKAQEGLAQAKKELKKGLGALEEQLALFEKTLQAVNVSSRGSELRVALKATGGMSAALPALLVPAVQKVREAAARTEAINNLKQIGLAMHNYHSNTKSFPPASIGGGLSWRVALLPYLEEHELFRQFRVNEPWDSAHNKQLLPRMPKVYAPLGAGSAPPGHTYLQVFTGPGTLFDAKKPATLASITDGSSNTLLVVEASQAVPWTMPQDIPYQPSQLPKLGGQFPNVFLALFGDASVRSLPRNLDAKTLHGLITPTGGEAVNVP
jgi:hypothetical protein